MPLLSKSKYLEGLKCPKLLWYRYNRKHVLPPLSRELTEIFRQGHIVGELARTLFPGGEIVERDPNPQVTSNKSLLALKSRRPLFEAGFVHKNGYALADILVPVEDNAWDLIEVKSSTRVKDENLDDVAFQKYVYQGRGVKLRRLYLMYLNRDYIKQGPLDLNQLFLQEEITAQVDKILPQVETRIDGLLKIIAGPEPAVWVDSQCKDCLLEEICKKELPSDHVSSLYRGGKTVQALMEQGVFRLQDIPVGYELTDKQEIQVRAHRKGEAYLERAGLRAFLNQLRYPLYFLDFETIALAVPYYDLTRPYEDVPFQFSLHVIRNEGAKPEHVSFLADGQGDPRPELLKKLKGLLGQAGSLVAFNANYEKMCLQYAARAYPEYQDWSEELEPRLVDLYEPFRQFVYYHPRQNGSASMKKILPALTGINYDGLSIAGGDTARFEYMRVIFDDHVDPKDKESVFAALEKYCELDTRAMVEILSVLQSQA